MMLCCCCCGHSTDIEGGSSQRVVLVAVGDSLTIYSTNIPMPYPCGLASSLDIQDCNEVVSLLLIRKGHRMDTGAAVVVVQWRERSRQTDRQTEAI